METPTKEAPQNCDGAQAEHHHNFLTSFVRLQRVWELKAMILIIRHTEILGKSIKRTELFKAKTRKKNKHLAPLRDSFPFILPVWHEFEEKKPTREYVRNIVQHLTIEEFYF